MSAGDVLPAFLGMTVPLRIAELQAAGGPTQQQRDWCRIYADRLGSDGTALLYRTTSRAQRAARTDTASMAADLSLALAILAFQPGGVKFGSLRFDASSCACTERKGNAI